MTTKTPHIPHIHLLCMEEQFIDAFNVARKSRKLPDSISIEIHNCALSQLSSKVKFDTVVSPANSYGRLDGAFDDAISRQFSPRDDYHALTGVAQAQLYKNVAWFRTARNMYFGRNPQGVRSKIAECLWDAACCAMPDDAWDKEVVYECIWSLLCAIDNHNHDASEYDQIQSVLMTPLATGVGRVSPEKWALQTVLAMKHFLEASDNPEKWSSLQWADLGRTCAETQLTWTK
ncbi:Macro domain-like [Fusarium oxysporum f. sp. vasinfectum]|nr:Macro domain-like [Fusarium oxysporum f. sp. vasinfectum]